MFQQETYLVKFESSVKSYDIQTFEFIEQLSEEFESSVKSYDIQTRKLGTSFHQ